VLALGYSLNVYSPSQSLPITIKKVNNQLIAYNRLKDSYELEAATWAREKARMTADYNSQLSSMQREKDSVIKNAQEEMEARAAQLKKSFEKSLNEVMHVCV
jgi:hypothetical protein